MVIYFLSLPNLLLDDWTAIELHKLINIGESILGLMYECSYYLVVYATQMRPNQTITLKSAVNNPII